MVVGLRYVYTLCFQFSLLYRFQGGPKSAEILNHCSVYSTLFNFSARGAV